MQFHKRASQRRCDGQDRTTRREIAGAASRREQRPCFQGLLREILGIKLVGARGFDPPTPRSRTDAHLTISHLKSHAGEFAVRILSESICLWRRTPRWPLTQSVSVGTEKAACRPPTSSTQTPASGLAERAPKRVGQRGDNDDSHRRRGKSSGSTRNSTRSVFGRHNEQLRLAATAVVEFAKHRQVD